MAARRDLVLYRVGFKPNAVQHIGLGLQLPSFTVLKCSFTSYLCLFQYLMVFWKAAIHTVILQAKVSSNLYRKLR